MISRELMKRSALGLVTAICVAGCVNPTPVFDAHAGQSLTTLRAQQTLNPDAPMANAKRIPEGMDGRAARETLERYQRSFQQPEKQTDGFTIGSGNSR
jgi:hypothetical protein